LEWAALSRLTGDPVYEEKARKAMDFLWNQRHRGSDLMGTVLNVNSGHCLLCKLGIKKFFYRRLDKTWFWYWGWDRLLLWI